MFKRIEEFHQEEAFSDMESARRYAERAERSTMKFKGFLKKLKSLGITGRYLEIGAGPAALAVKIAQNDLDVRIIAFELSQDMATVGREYVSRHGLEDRIEFVVGNAENEDTMSALGMFDLVYSTYTLHHWKDPKKAIRNLTRTVADGGVLYLHDLRRVWWLYWLPVHNGLLDSIRAAYLPFEIREMLQELGIDQFEIKKVFPFMQSIIVKR